MNNRNELRFNRSIRVLFRWRGAWSIANERPNHDLESGMVSKPDLLALKNGCCIPQDATNGATTSSAALPPRASLSDYLATTCGAGLVASS